MVSSQRWWITFPFTLALAVFILLAWSAIRVSYYPHDGILGLNPTGLINEIDPAGPAHGKLQVGDVVVSIDNVPWAEAISKNAYRQVGDDVRFNIVRQNKTISVEVILSDPPWDEVLRRLTPFLMALIFWGASVSVQIFKPNDLESILFFLFFQATAVFLVTGVYSPFGPPWVSGLFSFFLWLIGPLSVHFHLYFPQKTTFRVKTHILLLLYTLAAMGGLPYLIWGPTTLRSLAFFPLLYGFSRVFLVCNLLVSIGLLFYTYKNTSTPGVHGKIRIVVLGGVLSVVPIITLTILPDILLKKAIIPSAFSLLLMGFLPLTYVYAIFRYRLIEIESHVNRGATYLLVYSLLGGVYLVLYYFFHQYLPISPISEPFLNTILVLLLASIFIPLRQNVQRYIDTVFYGGWYDYRTAVKDITQGLERITDLSTLAMTVSDRLVNTLRLSDSCVFLRDLDGDFSVVEVAPRDKLGEQVPAMFTKLPRSSLAFLLKMGDTVERKSLRNALSEITLSQEELQLLNSEQEYLWVPVIGHNQIRGLMALGPKFGSDTFSSEDLDILRIVASQLGPLIENIHLVTRLKRYAADLERRVADRTEELYSAKERVEAILASVGDGVVVTDLSWNVITVNTAFERQSGYLVPEAVGRNVWDFFGGHDGPKAINDIETTLQQGDIWNGELVNYSSHGMPYDVQLTIAPMHDHSRRMVGYVGSQRDITRYKQLDRIKDRLIFDVSHELRTPVTNLNLYLELIENGKPEKRNEYLQVLKKETGRLIELIESILDLSRLDMWKEKKMELSAVDINAVAEQVIEAHRPLAESTGLELIFQPASDLPQIRGEQNQLARLVTNLLSNAIRYTPAGSINVRTNVDNSFVHLQVQDTGIGIEPEDIPHLFERFYRGKQVSQSKITGNGLGLAIVKEIVDIHEGKINILSEVGVGSVFNVWLPVQK